MTNIYPSKTDLKAYYELHNRKETSKFFNLSEYILKRLIKKYGIESNRTSRRTHLPANLNTYQTEQLIGNLLGDGWLEKLRNKNCNSSFGFKQKQENSIYVKALYEIFEPFSKNIYENVKSKKPSRIDGRVSHDHWNGEYCYSCMFNTCRHSIFTDLENKWYLRDNSGNYILNSLGNRTKVVPRDLKLTWRIAAIWACDDGYNNNNQKYFILCTDSFSNDDIKFLISRLQNDLGIKSSILKLKNEIIMCNKNATAFIDGIKEYISWDCFAHKIKY